MVNRLPPTKYQILGNSLLIVNLLCFLILMASSSYSRKSYHVFLSFRGPDVRNNFLSHLYTALDQLGIYTYMDSEELRKGEQITPELIKAIENSRIAIIIFFEDYASSVWCLDKLTKIMECKKQKDLIVLPVFYKVEPREVRTPRGIYREAMAKHENKFGKQSDKVKRWKEALLEAGSLSGWEFTDGCEAGLVQDIVRQISTQLNPTPLNVAKYPVGIDSRVQEIKKILNLQSKDDVCMIGLWGQGGVGKTTLAKAIYNAICREFQGSSFLDCVSENSKSSNDMVHLQKKLLSMVLGKKLEVFNVHYESLLIQDRLCNKKVLIIIDDVDDAHQLNALAGNGQWFGKGSRIVITTRNKHLLTSHGVDPDHLYEVKALEDGEALELFRKHAVLRNQIRSDLVVNVLNYAGGLPLALAVLGSFLHGRGEHEWESALKNLAKRPKKEINNVLKVSYEGLEDCAKEIFLDIACFFKGKKTKYIKKVLDSCDFDTTIWVQILIERSLISEETGTLQMHDLIQLMGRDIVEEECRDDPSKRSRLWLYDDVLHVLSGDMGTDAIKAIVLKLPMPKEMHIGPNAFTNMRKLRLLILRNVHNSFTGPILLPNELRWFKWPHCASIPEFRDGPKKLVGLYLQNSNIERVLKQFKDFEKLTFINLMECQSLVSMPDLSCMPNLKDLDLQGCENLERAHESIAYHSKLQFLNLDQCSKLQSFPDIPIKNEALVEIQLRVTGIKELPSSIENLVSLKRLNLCWSRKLAILPSSIYRLPNLEYLQLDDCSKLIKFPKKEEEDLGEPHTKTGFPKLTQLDLRWCDLSEVEFLENLSCFPHLQKLNLQGNNFTNLPTCEKLYNLEDLDVSYCHQLQEISKIPGKLRIRAEECESLSRLPSNICDAEIFELYSRQKPVRNGFSMNDFFKLEKFHRQKNCRLILPGEEMPKWLLPNKEGYISFVASKDLYKKILGVAFCVVFRVEGHLVCQFECIASVNCEYTEDTRDVNDFDLDHVLLEYMESKDVWTVDDFGPKDSSHFHFSIRVYDLYNSLDHRVFVKKCGFRLICKPLENDLEFLCQDDPLLDPALLYEVPHEGNPTNKEEESSSETEDLQDSESSEEEEGLNMVDFSIEKHRYSRFGSNCRNVRPGVEMPKEFVIVEDGTISFIASQDLYNKFKGLFLCVVFGVEDGKKEVSFDIVPRVNGQRRNGLSGTLGSFDTDHVWFQLLMPNALWGMLEGSVDFGQFDKSYLQFSLDIRVAGGTVKKLGYHIQSLQLGDALKVELEKNRLMDPASLCEDRQHPWCRFIQRGYPYKNSFASIEGETQMYGNG